MKKNIMLVALAAAAFTAGAAHAQSAGNWMAGVGATWIHPNVSSGDLSAPAQAGTKIGVQSDTQPTGWVSYMLTDHWSVEVPIGAGFKHKIVGAGAVAGVGQIGSVKALPITAFGQYRFLEPSSQFRPYAMLGVTYAHFYGARGSAALNAINPANPTGGGTGLSVDSKWGLSPGLGVTVSLKDRWFLDVQYSRTFLKTTSHLSTGQSISTKLNPDAVRVGVGYRF